MKPLPEDYSFINLFLPNTNHTYFNPQGKPGFLFESQKSSFSLTNAWWLAEASMLVYVRDREFIRRQFKGSGLPVDGVEFIGFGQAGTQCFVVHNAKDILVSFRGTEPNEEFKEPNAMFDDESLEDSPSDESSSAWMKIFSKFPNVQEVKDNYKKRIDLITDLKFVPENLHASHQRGGKAHSGFQEALNKVWSGDTRDSGEGPSLLDTLSSIDRGQSLWFTGHSLGAALATLAADRYKALKPKRDVHVYTYGSPRVGNGRFVGDTPLKNYVYRFINVSDLVTWVPTLPYIHMGEPHYIDPEDKISVPGKGLLDPEHSVPFAKRVSDATKDEGNHLKRLGALDSGRSVKGYQLRFAPLVNHTPILYATRIWNFLESGHTG